MKKKIILTKKRLKALDIALSIDDVLYEKMRRMEERTQIMLRKWYRENQVVSVRRFDKSGIYHELCILKEIKTGEGIYVTVT